VGDGALLPLLAPPPPPPPPPRAPRLSAAPPIESEAVGDRCADIGVAIVKVLGDAVVAVVGRRGCPTAAVGCAPPSGNTRVPRRLGLEGWSGGHANGGSPWGDTCRRGWKWRCALLRRGGVAVVRVGNTRAKSLPLSQVARPGTTHVRHEHHTPTSPMAKPTGGGGGGANDKEPHHIMTSGAATQRSATNTSTYGEARDTKPSFGVGSDAKRSDDSSSTDACVTACVCGTAVWWLRSKDGGAREGAVVAFFVAFSSSPSPAAAAVAVAVAVTVPVAALVSAVASGVGAATSGRNEGPILGVRGWYDATTGMEGKGLRANAATGSGPLAPPPPPIAPSSLVFFTGV